MRRSFLLTSLFALAGGAAAAADPWEALRSGDAFVLLRHAIAPGTGDPPGMRIGDCDTQRNLSADGRAQAERIGQLFRDNRIRQVSVFSSQWCRCVDTAELLGLGPVTEQPLLNSFFGGRADGREQTEGLAGLADRHPIRGTTRARDTSGEHHGAHLRGASQRGTGIRHHRR
ncbi:MAG: histidine phosphatase family protein [Rhizobium sp.]|nr:histidine phosphatase family protein [Rhizobium sp.]